MPPPPARRTQRSRRFICGATTYPNLKAWALCKPCEPFLPPPNLNQQPNEVQTKMGQLFAGVKAKAEAKMEQRRKQQEAMGK